MEAGPRESCLFFCECSQERFHLARARVRARAKGILEGCANKGLCSKCLVSSVGRATRCCNPAASQAWRSRVQVPAGVLFLWCDAVGLSTNAGDVRGRGRRSQVDFSCEHFCASAAAELYQFWLAPAGSSRSGGLGVATLSFHVNISARRLLQGCIRRGVGRDRGSNIDQGLLLSCP